MANSIHWTVYANLAAVVFFAGVVPSIGFLFFLVRRLDRMESKVDAILTEQGESRQEQHQIKATVEKVREEVIRIDGRVTALERMRT